MKTFSTLLKIAQGRMDALGLEVARIQERIDAARMEMATVSTREESEAALAASDPTLAPFLPAYQARVKQEMSVAQSAVAEAEATLEILREQLAEAWREKSKFEQLIERTRLAEVAVASAAEMAQLDEAAVNRAGRD